MPSTCQAAYSRKWVVVLKNTGVDSTVAHAEVNFATALVPSLMACLASSPGRVNRVLGPHLCVLPRHCLVPCRRFPARLHLLAAVGRGPP